MVEPTRPWSSGKADDSREETGTCTTDATGIGAQASRDRLAEITSGTSTFQQGLAPTCKDSQI
ncbi:MAG: hypothetical protein ACYTGS_13500 [Planctomycetota bacterium]